MNQIKLVCTAYDKILAIERLHPLTARTDECFNTYKSREGKNRERRDHSRAPRLDMLISYQLATDKPDVEVSRIQVQKKTPTCLQEQAAHTTGVQTRALSEVLNSSTTEIPVVKNLYHTWKLNLNPLVKKT